MIGNGTRLITINAITIGNASVFIQANDGFDFGIPGGSTTASLDILAGAELDSVRGIISLGPFGGSPTGTETTDATVRVSGASSEWTLDEFLAISPGANATGTLIVSSNGLVSTPELSVATPDTSVAVLRVQSGGLIEASGFRVAEETGSMGTVVVSSAHLTSKPGNDGNWVIGNSGNATLKIQGGGEVINDQIFGVTAAQTLGSAAKISLVGDGSLFDAGSDPWLGWNPNTNSAGGTCKETVGRNTVIRADQITVGPGCKIKGRGTLEGVVTNNGGFIAPSVTIAP